MWPYPKAAAERLSLRRVRAGDYYPPDLAALPLGVRRTAHISSNGEVAWPNEDAEAAINALAGNGHVILGLDAWTLFPDGGVMEIPISAGHRHSGVEDPAERGRLDALDALPLAKTEGTHVLITW